MNQFPALALVVVLAALAFQATAQQAIDANPSAERAQIDSWLAQIETRVAQTAQRLDVESAGRRIKVKADTILLRGEIDALGAGQFPGSSRGAHRQQAIRARAERIEYRETISAQRDALIKAYPVR